jgi:hypothetical protein
MKTIEYYRPKINWNIADGIPLDYIKGRLDSLSQMAQNPEARIPIESPNRVDYEKRAIRLAKLQEELYLTCQLFWARRTEINIEPKQVLAWYDKVYDQIGLAIDALEDNYTKTEGEKKTPRRVRPSKSALEKIVKNE